MLILVNESKRMNVNIVRERLRNQSANNTPRKEKSTYVQMNHRGQKMGVKEDTT
jgi:hypothetical protein